MALLQPMTAGLTHLNARDFPEDFREEGFVPPGFQSLALNAPAPRHPPEEGHGDPPEPAQVRPGMPGPGPVRILPEGHVEDPVELVLDPPVPPDQPQDRLGVRVQAADEVPDLGRLPPPTLAQPAHDGDG